jgi:hypothetical protein
VIEARDEGLAVRLRGPFRPPDLIPWGNIVDIEPGEIVDEGDVLVLLQIELFSRGELPDHPWGARWVETRTLGLLAQDWSIAPTRAAEELGQYAVEAAQREARPRTARIPDPT